MRLALYEPDIPQNTGTLLRLGACLGVGVAIVGTPGFVLSDQRLKRAGMDYIALAEIARYADLDALRADIAPEGRLILCTTHATLDFRDVTYRPGDVLLMGRESAGVPDEVHEVADLRVTIPLAVGARSLNVAVSAAMVLSEALRQTHGFPGDPPTTD
ncbi:MAG: tRNA (cytidine/uridine-2'-O-)-methyltransferase [Alphaproteobacteria bacterium]|jgi:tRNA (cytidine/uridine-2'-O-)-methyltransferase